MAHERYIRRVGEALLPTPLGEFRMIAYASEIDGGESHIALVRGDIEHAKDPVLVRMHSHCVVGDVFRRRWCDCHNAIQGSLHAIVDAGCGALIYLHQNSKSFAVEQLGDKTVLSFHRESRLPTIPAHQRKIQREVGIGAQILVGLKSAPDSPAYESSAQGRRSGGLRHRNCRPGSYSGAPGSCRKIVLSVQAPALSSASSLLPRTDQSLLQ